jgi:hypothetical protein
LAAATFAALAGAGARSLAVLDDSALEGDLLAFLAVAFDCAAVLAKASPGIAAKEVATATDTATDITVRSATPCITFSGENISVFISVLFWKRRESTASVVKLRNLSNIKHLSTLFKPSCKPRLQKHNKVLDVDRQKRS